MLPADSTRVCRSCAVPGNIPAGRGTQQRGSAGRAPCLGTFLQEGGHSTRVCRSCAVPGNIPAEGGTQHAGLQVVRRAWEHSCRRGTHTVRGNRGDAVAQRQGGEEKAGEARGGEGRGERACTAALLAPPRPPQPPQAYGSSTQVCRRCAVPPSRPLPARPLAARRARRVHRRTWRRQLARSILRGQQHGAPVAAAAVCQLALVVRKNGDVVLVCRRRVQRGGGGLHSTHSARHLLQESEAGVSSCSMRQARCEQRSARLAALATPLRVQIVGQQCAR